MDSKLILMALIVIPCGLLCLIPVVGPYLGVILFIILCKLAKNELK